MSSYKDLVTEALADKAAALKEDGNYDTTYTLTPDQIKVAAANAIASGTKYNAAASFDSYYIGDAQDCSAVMGEKNFAAFYADVVDSALTSIANNQRPAFFSVSDGAHFVTVALVPDYEDVNKINVIYVNSMPEAMDEYKDHERGYQKTGKNFAQSLVNYLTAIRKKNCGEKYTDLSKDQQYGECCGLSVALNIAAIAKHCADKKPIDSLLESIYQKPDAESAREMYTEMGKQLFSDPAAIAAPVIPAAEPTPGAFAPATPASMAAEDELDELARFFAAPAVAPVTPAPSAAAPAATVLASINTSARAYLNNTMLLAGASCAAVALLGMCLSNPDRREFAFSVCFQIVDYSLSFVEMLANQISNAVKAAQASYSQSR